MMIKTADGEKSVGSAGVAGAGLGLGIAGTALALLNNNCGNGGILGNLFGGNGGGGSSYTNSSLCTNVSHTQGYRNGNGYITLTPIR